MTRRLLVALMAVTLLTACATKPDGNYDDSACTPNNDVGVSSGNPNPLVDVAAVLLVDITWFAGCEAVVGIANGIHHFHRILTHEGVYYSPDGLFSVAVPGGPDSGYQTQQETAPNQETVVFVPPTPAEPVYGITALLHLDAADSALSLQDFAEQASARLPVLGDGKATGGLTEVRAEDLHLGANPARLLVYRAQAPASETRPALYYLVYFVKTAHAAVTLTIALPGDCPECAEGREMDLRKMDPMLGAFLDSFELTNKGR